MGDNAGEDNVRADAERFITDAVPPTLLPDHEVTLLASRSAAQSGSPPVFDPTLASAANPATLPKVLWLAVLPRVRRRDESSRLAMGESTLRRALPLSMIFR